MRYAEVIVKAYQARGSAESWPDFVKKNPLAAKILDEAERLANGE